MANSWNRSNWWRRNFGALLDPLDTTDDARWRDESALTPVGNDVSSTTLLSQKDLDHRVVAETYQRTNLHGFTTAELITLSAITDEELKPNNLEGDLHPLVARNIWDKSSTDPFDVRDPMTGDFISGEWEPQNDREMWEAIMPALQLVTRFLDNAHIFPIFDALLFPQVQTLPRDRIWPYWGGKHRTPEEIQNYGPLYLFGLRSMMETQYPDAKTEVQKKLQQLADTIRLGVFDGRCNHPSETAPEDGKVLHHGLTTSPSDDPDNITRLYVAWQTIAPLLREDLTTSMRLAQQFQLAVVILHELAHCIRFSTFPECTDGPDPYFSQDRLAEIGNVLESQLFGFRIAEIISSDRNATAPATDRASGPFFATPAPGFVLKSWPREEDHVSCAGPPLLSAEGQQEWGGRSLCSHGKEQKDEIWALGIGFVEEIQQEEFWDVLVPVLGAAVLKAYPLVARAVKVAQDTAVIARARPEEEKEVAMEWKVETRTKLWVGDAEPWETWVRSTTVEDILYMDEKMLKVYSAARDRVNRGDRTVRAFGDFQAQKNGGKIRDAQDVGNIDLSPAAGFVTTPSEKLFGRSEERSLDRNMTVAAGRKLFGQGRKRKRVDDAGSKRPRKRQERQVGSGSSVGTFVKDSLRYLLWMD